MFDGFDMVMLGDIHKDKLLEKDTNIFACVSSMIQQNHGELLENHGCLLWDIPTRTFT